MIEFDDFMAVDMRVGRIVAVEEFPEARKPAWKLTVDFGDELGTKRSSAQITNYTRDELEDRLVVAVVNFPPRQIGPFMSEVLVLGAYGEQGEVLLLNPEPTAPLGSTDRLTSAQTSPITFRRRLSACIANSRDSLTVTPKISTSSSPGATHFGRSTPSAAGAISASVVRIASA